MHNFHTNNRECICDINLLIFFFVTLNQNRGISTLITVPTKFTHQGGSCHTGDVHGTARGSRTIQGRHPLAADTAGANATRPSGGGAGLSDAVEDRFPPGGDDSVPGEDAGPDGGRQARRRLRPGTPFSPLSKLAGRMNDGRLKIKTNA
jgi:hypothetical protein